MQNEPRQPVQDVIAYRRHCDAAGTGLSHYILVKE
jgi:modified peptide precursor CbpA